MKYALIGYEKNDDVYEVIETHEDLEYLKLKGCDIAEIQKETNSFRFNGIAEPFVWFEIVQENNYDVVYWVSYKEDECGNRIAD